MNVKHLLLLLFFCISSSSYAIEFITPAKDENISVGKTYLLEWEELPGAVYSIFYSEDNGVTLVPIETNLDQNTYEWTVPELNNPKIKLYCEAYLFKPPQLLYEDDLQAGRISSVSYNSSDSSTVISTIDNKIFILDKDLQRENTYSLAGLGTLFDSDFIRSDSLLFSAGDKVYIFDLNSETYTEFAAGKFQSGFDIEKAVFNELRNEIAIASYDGSFKIFDLTTESEVLKINSSGAHQFYSLRYSNDSKYVAAGDKSGRVYIYDFENNVTSEIAPKNSGIVWNIARAIDFSRDNSEITIAYADGSFSVYDLNSLEEVAAEDSHNGQLRAVNYHPTEDLFLIASMDKYFTQWENFASVHKPVGDNLVISDACYSVSGDTIALVTYEGIVQFWLNFERTRDSAKTEINIKYDLKIVLDDYKVKLNDKVAIKPRVEFNYSNANVIESISELTVEYDFPAKSLWPIDEINETRDGKRFYFTESVDFDLISSNSYLVLYNSEERKASLNIVNASLSNEMVNIVTRNGSIEIEDECLYDFSETQLASKANIFIYPFPAEDEISISCKLPENQVHEFKIYSVSGKHLAGMTGKIDYNAENKKINISKFSNGLYTFEIISMSGQKYYRQILIQK